MANIQTYLNNIKNALFGKDVRSSIHDGIDAINKEVESTTGRQVDLENTFDQFVINAGNSNAEIVDARVKNDGTSYSKLGDRLNEVDSQLAHTENVINYYDVITAKAMGAIGNGLIDDTQSIKNAISYCATNNKILHMSGDYLITDTIDITCNIIGEPNFYANVGRDKPALKIGKHRLKLELGDIQDYQNKSDYYNNYHGFANENYIGLLIDDIHGCNISFNNLRTFDVGVKISSKSSTGSAFNYIKGNTIMNCKKGLLLSTSNGGWINTNRFENVAFSFSDSNSNYTNDENEKYFIYEEFSDSIGCDSNIFDNLRMETTVDYINLTCIDVCSLKNSVFNNLRTEIVKPSVKGVVFNAVSNDFKIRALNFINQLNFGHFSKELICGNGMETSLLDISNLFGDKANMITLCSNTNLLKDARYPTTDYQCLIKGSEFVDPASLDLNTRGVLFARNDTATTYGISFSETQPYTVYLMNMSQYSTFHISTKGHYTAIRLKCWDADGNEILEPNLLAGAMSFNSSTGIYRLNAENAEQNIYFSVLSDNVKTVTIHFSNYLYAFEIATLRNEYIAPRMKCIGKTNFHTDADDYKYDEFSFTTKPTRFLISRFKVGEMVYDRNDMTKVWVLIPTTDYYEWIYDNIY